MTSRKPPFGPASRRRGAESIRPPRYRLMTAAAKLPRRPPVEPSVAFESDCAACGRSVLFTQIARPGGTEYEIEDHDCA